MKLCLFFFCLLRVIVWKLLFDKIYQIEDFFGHTYVSYNGFCAHCRSTGRVSDAFHYYERQSTYVMSLHLNKWNTLGCFCRIHSILRWLSFSVQYRRKGRRNSSNMFSINMLRVGPKESVLNLPRNLYLIIVLIPTQTNKNSFLLHN